MKQLVILSGKGGAGKTSLAAAFAHLAHAGPQPLRAVLADVDVDAANLELALRPQRLERHPFIGGGVAVIHPPGCTACGECAAACRFDAILPPNGNGCSAYAVDPIACEGCAACLARCPHDAIHMQPQQAGEWYRSQSCYGPLLHAELRPAQENSGKLVTLVKQQARLAALDGKYPLLLVDGPPGIGCPVISALSGADLALIVAEPTAAGIHDMTRILGTAAHFSIPVLICINKADIYPQGAVQIHTYCQEHGLELAGMVPYDETVSHAAHAGEPISAYSPDSPAAKAIGEVWLATMRRMGIEVQA